MKEESSVNGMCICSKVLITALHDIDRSMSRCICALCMHDKQCGIGHGDVADDCRQRNRVVVADSINSILGIETVIILDISYEPIGIPIGSK